MSDAVESTKQSGNTIQRFRDLHNPFGDASQITVDFYRDLPKSFRSAIVFAVQNATPPHHEALACFINAAKYYRSEVFAIPLRYKNPTSNWTGSQKNAEQWHDAFKPYMWNQRLKLNANLTLFADVPTQPTDTTPLSGFDAMSGPASAIYGHVKLQSTIIPVPTGRMGKVLTTTGAATVDNFTLTKRGKIGEFHHSLCALLIELRGDKFYVRQLHYSGEHNSVTDGLRGKTFHPNGVVTEAPRPLALCCGDIHVDFIDPQVWKATLGVLHRLNPESVILPDLLDSYAVNHHTEDDLLVQKAKADAGRRDIQAETMRAVDWTRRNAGTWRDTEWVVQASNHNDMLRRWILRKLKNGFATDVHNMEFGLETALHMARNAKMTKHGASYPDPLHYWFNKQEGLEANIRLLNLDEPYSKGGIALHLHGDLGANGARGSRKGFAHMGDKSVTDHTHSDYIYEGNYGTGTKTFLQAEYNHGLSGWTNADVLVQYDGKRQVIRYIDGRCNN